MKKHYKKEYNNSLVVNPGRKVSFNLTNLQRENTLKLANNNTNKNTNKIDNSNSDESKFIKAKTLFADKKKIVKIYKLRLLMY